MPKDITWVSQRAEGNEVQTYATILTVARTSCTPRFVPSCFAANHPCSEPIPRFKTVLHKPLACSGIV